MAHALIWCISEKSALAVEIDLTWSQWFVSVELGRLPNPLSYLAIPEWLFSISSNIGRWTLFVQKLSFKDLPVVIDPDGCFPYPLLVAPVRILGRHIEYVWISSYFGKWNKSSISRTFRCAHILHLRIPTTESIAQSSLINCPFNQRGAFISQVTASDKRSYFMSSLSISFDPKFSSTLLFSSKPSTTELSASQTDVVKWPPLDMPKPSQPSFHHLVDYRIHFQFCSENSVQYHL
ncbi:hypothetical protein Tco_0327130 [Tanacetum coccineum]